MTSKRRAVFREGDAVRIINPEFVTRVGYPKSLDDYREEAGRRFGSDIVKIFTAIGARAYQSSRGWRDANNLFELEPTRAFRRILSEFAHEMAKVDGFGGRERKLHTIRIPELQGQACNISRLRTVRTGMYYGPSGNGEDWEPGGLDDGETHRLAELIFMPVPERFRSMENRLEISTKNLEHYS